MQERVSAGQRSARDERGVTMVMAMLVMATMLVLLAGGLVSSGASLRTTHNYGFATQALYVAESGLLDAVKTINGPGIVDYQTEVAEPWSTVFGGNARTFSGPAGYGYSVMPVVTAWDAADPADRGTLRAVATGPRSTTTAVVARLTRSNIPGTAPGAVYLANDNPTDADFDGNAFLVDGNDRNYTGGPGSAPAVPGIATRNAVNATETIDSMNGAQRDNVTGLGFNPGPPVIPSVQAAPAGPSQEHINQIIDALLERPHSTCAAQVINNSSSCTFGTTEAPQITYFTSGDGVTVHSNGNISGAGILIVEGGLRIQGTVDWRGLILVRGPTEIDYDMDTDITGSATLYGALWTTDLSFEVGGSAIVQYSSQGLALANQSGGGGALPAPVTVVSLLDCSMVTPGTSGCP